MVFGSFFVGTASAMTGVATVAAATGALATQDASSCNLTPGDIQAVTAAQAQGFNAELAARKDLLKKIISCAKTDTQTLKNKLTSIAVSDDAKIIQSQLASKLDDAMNYYDLELVKADGAGIAGTKGIAKEVFDSRSANYDPLAGQVANFILWEQNQNLFTIAATRAHQMRGAVSFLQQAAPNNDLQSAIASAETLVITATKENESAKIALLQSLPPDASLSLILQSLTDLSAAYKKFTDLGATIQTLLPTDK